MKLMITTTDEPTKPTKNMTSNTRMANIAIGMRLIVPRIRARCSWNLDARPGCDTLAPV
jgi:hypothetical protein